MFRPSSRNKWLSLSALSAGLAVAGESQASIINIPAQPPVGPGGSLTINLPGINDIAVIGNDSIVNGGWFFVNGAGLAPAAGATYFNVRRDFQSGTFGAYAFIMRQVAAGATWNTAGGTVGPAALFGGQDTLFSTFFGPGSFGPRFFLFQFKDSTDGGQVNFGWLLAEFDIRDRNNFELRILGGAFDDSGAPIRAGQEGAVPEPATGVALGMAALVLGAAGVRRWRKDKAVAPSTTST